MRGLRRWSGCRRDRATAPTSVTMAYHASATGDIPIRLAPLCRGFATRSDVDDYLNKLREALESAINNNECVEIC